MRMLLTIPEQEFFNDETEEYSYIESKTVELEHSLFTVYEWESKYNKPFLTDEPKTNNDILTYICMMDLSNSLTLLDLLTLEESTFQEINDFINASHTATTFGKRNEKNNASKQIVTSEIIYYWMTQLNIPMEWEHRHLNQLMTFIRVGNEMNNPKKGGGMPTDPSARVAANKAARARRGFH